jgi:autotransporter-associated beta strand protein
MRGGTIHFYNPTAGIVSESWGHVSLLEGDSLIDGGANNLSMQELERDPGATARFDFGTNTARPAASPSLSNGIWPWLLVNGKFGTLVNGEIRANSTYVSDINSAGAADNVRITANTNSLNDRVINSLTFDESFTALDLSGRKLQIDSGGIQLGNGGAISNGTVTAGQYDNELIVYGRGTVSADITDNTSGPVSLTVSPGADTYDVVLSGKNTYSGTTYVNKGALDLTTETALPDLSDLQIVGGEVGIGYTATRAKHLHHVRIAGDGALGNLGIFSFDEVVLEDGALRPGKIVGSGQIIKQTPGAASIGADTNGSTYNGNIVVQDGSLTVSGLASAKFRVEGGTLSLVTGANSITLAGGALEYLYLTGNITVEDSSRIIAEPRDNATNYGLTGSFLGSGNLLFENRPVPGDSNSVVDVSAASPTAFVRGHSPSFSGNVDIDTAVVAVAFEDSLGTGSVTIHPDGKLVLAPVQSNFSDAKLDFSNRVNLAGGELSGLDSVFRPQRLLGDLFVTDDSWIGTLEVPGTVHLANGSRLSTTEYHNTSLLGDVLVGGTAEFNVGRARVLSSAAEANRAVVRLGGRIVSDAPVSMLKIENAGLDDLVLASSFQVQAGQSLGIESGGELIELNVSAGSLSGGGTLLNPIRIGVGGHVSPGSSPGTLTFLNGLNLGPGSVYDWEVNNAMGTAGAGDGWDLLHVAKSLMFSSTQAQPFVFRVMGLDALPLSNFPNPDLEQPNRWLVATADSIAGFDPHTIVFEVVDSATRERTVLQRHLSLQVESGNLFLVYQVPEPDTLILFLAGAIAPLFAPLGTVSAGRLRLRKASQLISLTPNALIFVSNTGFRSVRAVMSLACHLQ